MHSETVIKKGAVFVLQGGEMKENEMDETHSRRGTHEECIEIWSRKQKWGKLFGILRIKLEGSIKTHIKELWVEGVDRVRLA